MSSILTVDPTFNSGKYSVTPVIYQELLLVSKRTSEHLICITPILISQNLTKDVYTDFVYCIQKNCPGLKEELRAFGTDGEKPLEQSSSERFPSSVKLRCMSHFRNNVKDHLKALESQTRNLITTFMASTMKDWLTQSPVKCLTLFLNLYEQHGRKSLHLSSVGLPQLLLWLKKRCFPKYERQLGWGVPPKKVQHSLLREQ